MRARTFVSVAVCVAHKLRPCPSYSREAGERMVVVVDSEYIFKAITVWTDK